MRLRYHLKKGILLGIVLACSLGLTEPAKASSSQKSENKKVEQYFSQSAFVGNSVSKGLQMYFDYQGKNFLGHPCMLVQESYSFANDRNGNTRFMISYQGQKYRAKDAIAKAKVKRVFISMGINDLWHSVSETYQEYVDYVEGIRRKNPDIIIFIQSTTPMCDARKKAFLNNACINALNKKMEQYCKKKKNTYYLDIRQGMTNSQGDLKYSSDGYVHMTMEGYRIWTNNLKSQVSKLLKEEQIAKDAVKKAEKKRTKAAYLKAKQVVKQLEKSTTREELYKELKGKIKKNLKKENPKKEKAKKEKK